MSSARAKHRKPRKIRRNGRHTDPARGRRATVVGFALPALAIAGTFAAYQLQPQQPDRIASSVASYNMRALVAGSARTDAEGAAQLTVPSATSSGPAKPKPSGNAAHSSPSAAPSPATTPTLTCSGTGGVAGTGMLPYNYATIVNFLVAHGYTAIAAAGVAGNIYQESKGDPESVGTGGGGLIGWTPLPSGFVTGDPAVDLQTQLNALLSYNQGWAQYIPMLNAATTPTDAADIYMTYFERPGIPAAANREGAAVAVAQACGIS